MDPLVGIKYKRISFNHQSGMEADWLVTLGWELFSSLSENGFSSGATPETGPGKGGCTPRRMTEC